MSTVETDKVAVDEELAAKKAVATETTPPAPATGDAADPSAAFKTKIGGEEYWYEEMSGRFWLHNAAGDWVDLAEGGFRRHLKKLGLRDKPSAKEVQEGKVISQVDEVLSDVEKNHRVAFAGRLAGYRAGMHKVAGRNVLVSESPEVITPVAGEWPTIKAFFDGLLVGEEPIDEKKTVTIDQRDRFYAWLQHVTQCYYEGIISPGLALCIAGVPNCGKSRVSMLLRWILGGRVAKPYAAMIGRDNFNRDLFESVLQLVDDESADTRIDARLKFAAEIKKIVANDEVKQRGMHRDGFTLSVLWRLVVLVNLQATRLMVLPPIDSDLQDKLLMFKGYLRPAPPAAITMDTPPQEACWPMPMPTRTEGERAAFRAKMRAELPAFLWWLLKEYKMPSLVSGGRFVVRHWQHPQILERLQQFSPHVRLWLLIDRSRCVFEKRTPAHPDAYPDTPDKWERVATWQGKASDLEKLLKSEASQLTIDEKRAIPEAAWLGQRLEAVSEHFGEGVCVQKRTGVARLWVINWKEGLVE